MWPHGTPNKFVWYEVELDTNGYEHRGKSGGLRELLLTGQGEDKPSWSDTVAALVGIQEVAYEFIQALAVDAASAACDEAANRLTASFAQPADAPPMPEVHEAMKDFKRVCELGSRRWDNISLAWDPSFGSFPEVSFGTSLGKPDEAVYHLDSGRWKCFYANGFWTNEYTIEEDFMEHISGDKRAKREALDALENLKDIQRTADRVVQTHKERCRQTLDDESVKRCYQEMVNEVPFTRADEWLKEQMHSSCVELFSRISDYLSDLNSQQA